MRIWVLGLAIAAAACSGSPPDESAGQLLRVVGSEALTHGLLPAMAGPFGAGQDVALEITVATEAEGMRALLDGEADLAATTRAALPNEEEQAKELGFQLNTPESRHIVGVDVVAVSVHPRNPTDSLTYDQIIGIFCTRSIDNWSFLGLEDRPIRAIARDPTSGTRALFEDFFCGPKGIHSRVEVLSVEETTAILAEDPGAITFSSMTEDAGKILGLRPDVGGLPIRPSQQNIIRGSYPLYHDLYLYTRGAPVGSAKAFLEWTVSPAGQDVVDEQRYVPLFLRPQRLDEARPLRETVHFEQDATAPNQRSSARLQLLVDELRERAGESRHIVLEGYTDTLEGEPTRLAQARAEAVRDLLQSELPGLYFEIIPRGPVHPIAPNDTPYGRQRNRRVQIYLAAEEAAADIVVEGSG